MHELDTPVAFVAPPGACDAHFHVFGPPEQYPYRDPNLRYTPPVAPLGEYLALAQHLGIVRMVFVQPSAYGRDNRCMLDAMAEVPFELRRGIVDIAEDAPEAEFAALDALGVRGVRVNVSPVKPPEPGFSTTMLARIARLDARCHELGWSLDFLAPGWLTTELLPTLAKLRSPFSLAHLGMNLARDGASAPGFVALLDLLRHHEAQAWVKLTGIYRMSQQPGFGDVAPLVEAVAAIAPDRLIWGSDFPHISFGANDSTVLFNLLAAWFPDAAMRRKVLTENPAALYGFRSSHFER